MSPEKYRSADGEPATLEAKLPEELVESIDQIMSQHRDARDAYGRFTEAILSQKNGQTRSTQLSVDPAEADRHHQKMHRKVDRLTGKFLRGVVKLDSLNSLEKLGLFGAITEIATADGGIFKAAQSKYELLQRQEEKVTTGELLVLPEFAEIKVLKLAGSGFEVEFSNEADGHYPTASVRLGVKEGISVPDPKSIQPWAVSRLSGDVCLYSQAEGIDWLMSEKRELYVDDEAQPILNQLPTLPDWATDTVDTWQNG